MKNLLKRMIAGMFALGVSIAAATPTSAAAFYAWMIVDVPAWDTLNVRAWPSSNSQILVAYPNDTVLSMTGKCTGGVDLGTVAGLPAWQQRQAVRHAWCETWVDPTGAGAYQTAWVYGKYIAPAH